MARLTRGRPPKTFAPKNQLRRASRIMFRDAKRSRANVLFLKSDQTFASELMTSLRSWRFGEVQFLLKGQCEGLEWTTAKNQGKKRAIYPLSIFPCTNVPHSSSTGALFYSRGQNPSSKSHTPHTKKHSYL